jgi:pyruvate/2-oxoglutarate dehydrogenase complex dihydrolipoamide dehydrogenase (E3) component
VRASEYDLVVIGSGPAGQKGAIAAAKARKPVAIIDRAIMIGGVSVHTGTIPSKTIREAIFQLTGFAVKTLYGNGSPSRVDISVEDVSSRVNDIVERETRSGVCRSANCRSALLPFAPARCHVSVGGKGDPRQDRLGARSCCCGTGERQEGTRRVSRLCQRSQPGRIGRPGGETIARGQSS